MHRVVITGIGIISSIGCDTAQIIRSLENSYSGITYQPDFAGVGMSSQVAGIPDIAGLTEPPRKVRRFMGDAALYAWHAVHNALSDAQFPGVLLSHPRTGLVMGSGHGSSEKMAEMHEILARQGIEKVSPYAVPHIMGNTVSANLSCALGIQGISYGFTSACATSAHCIGHAAELIQLGKQDVILAGGAEEVSWHSAMLFDAMGVLTASRNNRPETASRPYDFYRDGFVIAGGAAALVLESLEHAQARKAPIYAELVGYGVASDGVGMVNPSGEGIYRAMKIALGTTEFSVDYVNTHATGTQQGDSVELSAMQRLFGKECPAFSSTKGQTGHAIGASGAIEAALCLLMMKKGCVVPSVNIQVPDPILKELPWVHSLQQRQLQTVMCNSLGFGGTNAVLIFSTQRL